MMRPADFHQITQSAEFVPQAVFDRPVSYFTEMLKTTITEGYDDLDYYQGTAFILEGLRPVVVKHYSGHPVGTTTLYLPFDIAYTKQIADIVSIVAKAFDIPAEAVSWQRQTDGELLAS